MKNLLIKSFFILLLFIECSYAQLTAEINETYSPIQIEENNDYNQEELKNNKNIKNFIQQLENSNSLVIESINSNNKSELEIDDKISSNTELIDNENSSKLFSDEVSGDNEVKTVLDELGNENVLNNLEEENVNNGDTVSFSKVSSQQLDSLSVSSIGLYREDSLFNENIWDSIEIDRAKKIIKLPKSKIFSKELRKIFYDLLTSSYQYPLGEKIDEKELFFIRINLLSRWFQIDDFKEFIINLPSEEYFDEWKSWIVKDAFLKLEDEFACKIVENISSRNISNFWQLAQIFCLVINGREDEAIFTTELVKASGLEDKNFYILLDNMLKNDSNENIELGNLNILHIAMMDQIKNTIPSEFISKSPFYMLASLLNLKHLQPSLKAIILDSLIDDRLVKTNLIEERCMVESKTRIIFIN